MRRKKVPLLISVLLILLLPFGSHAATYWVNPSTGNDTTGDGSQGNPWKTIWYGVATRALVGGNTINIVGGTYTRDALLGRTDLALWRLTESHGTAGNPLIFQPAPGQNVTIDGSAKNNFFRFQAANGGDYHIIVRNIRFTNFTGDAIQILTDSWDTPPIRYIMIEGCTFDTHWHGSSSAINGGNLDYVIIRNTTIRDVGRIYPGRTFTPANAIHGIYFGDGARHVLIDNVVLSKIANMGIQSWGETGGAQPDHWPFENWIVRRTQFHNVAFSSHVGGGATVPTELLNWYWYHNTTYSTADPFPEPPVDAADPVYNLDLRAGIQTNLVVLNNIAVAPYRNAPLRWSAALPASIRMDYNLWRNEASSARIARYNNVYYSLAQWQTLTQSTYGVMHDSHTLSSDPAFTNRSQGNFVLQATSPAINAGTFLTTATNSGTTSTSLQVADAKFFMDGWLLTNGDTIQINTTPSSAPVQITAIVGNTLTLQSARTWSSGQGVSLPWQGTRPDMGALEFAQTATAPVLTITSPTSSTTYASPTATVAISGNATDSDGDLDHVTFSCVVQGSGSCTPSSGNANGTAAAWSLPTLTLSSGTTALVTVIAHDATGLQGQDTLTLTYTATPPPTQTYYVHPTGSDTTGNGSQALPWATIQRALNTAVAGDLVQVLPGTYVERLTFPSSGTVNSRITVQGTRDASGALVSIVDGSSSTSGWVTAPEIGSGVWKTTTGTLGLIPATATVGGKTIWKLGAHTWGHPQYDAATALARGATEQVSSSEGPVGWWDGLEGLFGVNGTTVYARVRNGDSPAVRNVRMAPSGGTLTFTGADYITIKDLQVQGGESQVHVGTGSTNITLTGVLLRDGVHRVLVNGNAATVSVQQSTLTLDDLGAQTYVPGNWHNLDYTGVVNRHRYDVNKFWIGNTETSDASVLIDDSTGVTVSDTLIEKGVAGITFYGTSAGVRITGTTIQNHSDNCVYAPVDSTTVEFDHNLVVNCDHLLRFEALHRDQTWHIYANRFWQQFWPAAQYLGGGKHLFFAAPITGTSPAILRIYQNTFAGGGWALDFGSGNFGPTLDWNVQNNLRTTHGWSSGPTGPWTFGAQAVDTTLWQTVTMPDFRLPVGHAALNSATGLTEGAGWTGMTATYYVDGLPDYGALQGTASTPVPTTLVWAQQPTNVYTATTMAPPVTVQVRDQTDNLYTATPLTLTLGLTVPGGAILSGTLQRQTVNGIATFDDLQIDSASGSPHTITVSTPGLPSLQSQPFTVTTLPPVATRLEITQQPTTGLVNSALTPAIVARVLDQNNTVFTASAVTVTVSKASGSGTLGGDLTNDTVNGVVTFSDLTLDAADTYTLTLSFTTGTTDDATTTAVVVSAASPVATALTFVTIPVSVYEDTPFAGTVQVLDQYGAVYDPDPELAITITKTAGSGLLTGGGPVTTVAGLATFNALQLNTQPTTATLQAASGGLTVATAQVDVGPLPLVPDHLFVGTQPTNTYAGYLLAPVTIRLLTAQNALVTDNSSLVVTLTLTDNTEGATLSGMTPTAVSSGIATFSTLAVNLPGSYTLTATAAGVTQVVSNAFQVDIAPLSLAEVHWQLNDGAPATTVVDSGVVPNRYPGTITGATWATPGHKQSNYLAFAAAANATVTHPTYTIPAASGFTAVFWVRFPAGTSTTQGLWQVGPGDPSDGMVAGARLLGGTSLEWYYGPNAAGGPMATPFPAVLLDTWVRVVLTATGPSGAAKGMYLNGQLQTMVASGVAPTVALTGLVLGRHQPYSTENYCTCDIEDFRLYHTPWSVAQVQADFAQAEPPLPGISAHPSGMLLVPR